MNRDLLYARLPVALQHAACTAYGWRVARRTFGGRFSEFLAEVEARSFWSPEALAEYRDARVRDVVRDAARTVPFYRRRLADAGVSPEDIGGMDDLAVLPLMTKTDAQEHLSDVGFERTPARDLVIRHTGGTTGAGLNVPSTLDSIRRQEAFYWRFRRWHGIEPKTWCAYFGGRPTVPAPQRRPPFWRINYGGRQILFSAYHLRPASLGAYLEALGRFRLPWIHGYPSALALLGTHALDEGIELGYRPRWITTGAETLLPEQRAVIERAFGVTPRDRYVMTEGVAAASECERGALHLDDDFAAVELVPTDGGAHRIVGTNLTNPAMPLLRYDTSDLAVPADEACGCGRPGRTIARIDGRLEDHLLLPDGTRLLRLARIFRDLVNIREAQIHQARVGEITVRVVRSSRYGPGDEAALVQALARRVGVDTHIRLEYVEELERSPSGKLRLVISDIPSARMLGT
jgi:phenylacetate-CoA ligase